MYELKSRVEEILEDLKNSGKIYTFSEEELREIAESINEKKRKVDLEYRMKQAQSIEDAKHIYITF